MNNEQLENEVCELTAELHLLDTFSGVFEEFARNSTYTQPLDYQNGTISCLSAQSDKIAKIIEIAERLETEARERKLGEKPQRGGYSKIILVLTTQRTSSMKLPHLFVS